MLSLRNIRSLLFTVGAGLLVAIPTARADLPARYEAQAGCDKQGFIWDSRIVPSAYSRLPSLDFGGWSTILNVLATPSSLLTLHNTFDSFSDEMPIGHRKFIHPFGTIAKVVYRSNSNHPFTGLFADGEVCGLARLSVAGPPHAIGFTPGMALKFFIDGRPSENMQVMESLQGQGDDVNFFSNMFTNSLPPIQVSIFSPTSLALKALEGIFATVKSNPRYLSVNALARVRADGTVVAPFKAPIVIWFVATREAKNYFYEDRGYSDFRNVLGAIDAGTVLYNVYGTPGSGEQPILMGTLSTTSEFVPSLYGDETLFFRHDR